MKVTIGAQYGDSQSDKVVNPLRGEFRHALGHHLCGSYFRSIMEIGFVLRVSGSIWKFEPRGVSRLRHSKARATLSLDLVLAQQDWKGVSGEVLRRNFRMLIEDSALQIAQKTERSKELIDKAAFLSDFERVIQAIE